METDQQRQHFREWQHKKPTMCLLGTTSDLAWTSCGLREKVSTGGLSPAKNELTGGASEATLPPAMMSGAEVSMGPKIPRLLKLLEVS